MEVFAGVRVLELAQYVFVPGAGALLADLGAEVIKVESVGTGDPYRTLSIGDGREKAEVNIALEQNNRGKKSIAIDLKSAKGRRLLLELVATADVFVTSLRPQALDRLGLSIEDVRACNPKIIYVRGSGFGFKGKERGKPGYDATAFWTRAGFATVLKPSNFPKPIRSRGALGDHAGSLGVAFGIAAALFKRERTGVPSVVESSLMATGMWVLSADITSSQIAGYDVLLPEKREAAYPLVQRYETRDGRWIQLSFLYPDRHWADLCRALQIEEYVDDPRFAKNEQRSRNGAECAKLLAAAIGKRDWAEWQPRFDALDAPWELARNIDELLEDPQAIANGYVAPAEMANGTRVKLVSSPLIMDDCIPKNHRRAPKLGEHTDELLMELGLSSEERAALVSEGIVQ